MTGSSPSLLPLWTGMLAGSALVVVLCVIALRNRSAISRGSAMALALVVAVLLLSAGGLVRPLEGTDQRRTMGALRTLGTALESYAVDHAAYPVLPAPPGHPFELSITVPHFQNDFPSSEGPEPRLALRNAAALASVLEPTYVRSLPTKDPWGNPLYYASTGCEYVVVSAGRNGVLEPWAWTSGPGSSWDDDYVFTNGTNFQY